MAGAVDPSGERASTARVLVRVLLPFALGYFVSYLLRNINAVIAPDLSAELALDAGALGALTAAYFLAFSAVQLPLGLLLDRYGPRRVESALVLVAAVGSALFATAISVPWLIVARALIGVGVAGCLMAALKATTLWVAPARQPLANGCITAFGGLGALAATAPVEVALRHTDWRGLFVLLTGVILVAAAVLYWCVPRRREESAGSAPPLADQLRGFGTVLRSRRFWHIGPLVIANASCFMAIQGLWAGAWLADVAGMDRDAVATHLLFIAGAMVAGFFGLGLIADRLARHGISTLQVATTAAILTTIITAVIAFVPDVSPLLIWVPYGFCGTCATLFFPVITQGFPVALSGRAVTTLNVGVFGAAFAVQWGLGEILDLYATGDGQHATAGYTMALGIAVCFQAAALLWLFAGRKSLASVAA